MEKIKERKIIFSTLDFNDETIIDSIAKIRNCTNPHDSYALVKCAAIISGLIKEDDINLTDLFDRVKSGIKITTDTREIPRGSGLGTSSIVAGTLLQALYKFMGIHYTENSLSYDVLRLEQLMSTGGGWQDQIGGIVKGIKLITTKPGIQNNFNIEKIKLSVKTKKYLNEKMILINTSQRRLARNLLRDVMGRYICGEPLSKKVLKEIQTLSLKMKESLEKDNISLFCKQLNKQFELSKKVNPGCTNTCIDFIFSTLDDYIDAKYICGAGGGGFLVVLLKENVTKKDIDKELRKVFQDIGVESCSIEIDGE